MRAFQCDWSAPRVRRPRPHAAYPEVPIPNVPYDRHAISDCQLLVTVLSALKWRQLNGPVRLYADAESYALYADLGLLDLWDDIDTEVLNQLDDGRVNPLVFWSAGKIAACLAESAPCVQLDMDLIVWHELDGYYELPLRFAYWESTGTSIWYPDLATLTVPAGYRFRENWQHSSLPAANTSLVYFGDQELKDLYAREALRFMRGNPAEFREGLIAMPEMLFADQRLLPLCAEDRGVPMDAFADATWYSAQEWRRNGERVWFAPFDLTERQLFTHVWFYKNHLEGSRTDHDNYCGELAKRVTSSFPHVVPVLSRIEALRPYFTGW